MAEEVVLVLIYPVVLRQNVRFLAMRHLGMSIFT